MAFLPSLGNKSRVSAERKAGVLAWVNGQNYGSMAISRSIPYQSAWDAQRAVKAGMEMTTWVYKAVDVIASSAAGLPFLVRKGDPLIGKPVKDHILLPFFNYKANPYTHSWAFRYQMSCLLLLDKQGVFVQVQKSRRNQVAGFYILQAGTCKPIPDAQKFVSGYQVQVGPEKVILPPDEVVWIKLPHPTDPYSSMTPLESMGLSVETDILAKMFNRNFLQNDGRPGGILAIKGGMEDEDAEILKNRFMGPAAGGHGPAGAGRLTVLETGDGGVDFVDTATSPRDAQWVDGRNLSKQEILLGFGVPTTILMDASNKTFDNAAIETETFWRQTMLPHLQVIARPFDDLTPETDEYPAYDTSGIYVLDRDKREQSKFFLEELKAGAINVDRYLEKSGQPKIGDQHRYILNNLVPYNNDGSSDLALDIGPPKPVAAPLPPASPTGQGGGGHPPGAPSGSQDNPAAPTGRGNTPSTPTGSPRSPSRRGGKELGPPEPLALPVPISAKGLEWGLWHVDPFSMKARTRTLGGRFSSWERHVKIQMEGYFSRQERVVMEKLRSAKSRSAWEAGKLSVDDIFDRARWDQQLATDSESWLSSVMADFGTDVVHELQLDWQPDHAKASVDFMARRIGNVNAETAGLIAKVLVRSRQSGLDLDMTAAIIEKVFTEAKSTRSASISSTEVVAAANTGIFVAGGITDRSDLVKTWTSLDDQHGDLDGTTVPFGEKFTIGAHQVDYPGDPAGHPDVTVGCRCVLTLGTPDGPVGIEIAQPWPEDLTVAP